MKVMLPWIRHIGSEEETEEFQTKFRKIISQDDQTSTAQSYEDIREIVRVEMINQIIFK